MRRHSLYLTVAFLTLLIGVCVYLWVRHNDPCKELMSGNRQAMTVEELNQKLEQCKEIKRVKPMLGP